MNELLSYCGLVCTTCPIYVATREGKKEEQRKQRIEIANVCREQYGLNYELADITDCDGCRADNGRIFSGCIQCTIRDCAKQKAVETCSHCKEYVCRKLEAFFVHDAAAKTRLDALRRGLM